jgi:hypothetical protein
MVQAILVWTGAVLAIGLLLVMALGPVIVEVDSWWYERKNKATKVEHKPAQARVVQPVG